MYPRELMVAELLDAVAFATPADVVKVLAIRLIAAVITTKEDRMLRLAHASLRSGPSTLPTHGCATGLAVCP